MDTEVALELEKDYAKYPELKPFSQKVVELKLLLKHMSEAVISKRSEHNEKQERYSTLFKEHQRITKSTQELVEKYDFNLGLWKELSANNQKAVTVISAATKEAGELVQPLESLDLIQIEPFVQQEIFQPNRALSDTLSKIASLTSELFTLKKTIEELEVSQLENEREGEDAEKALRMAADDYLEWRTKEVGMSMLLAQAMDKRRLEHSRLPKRHQPPETKPTVRIEQLQTPHEIAEKDEEIKRLRHKILELEATNTGIIKCFEEQLQSQKELFEDTHRIGTITMLRRRELERHRNLQKEEIIQRGQLVAHCGGAFAHALRVIRLVDEEEIRWYLNDFGMRPKYVWNVLRFAGIRWANILEWHSAMKHFHSSSVADFLKSDFKKKFAVIKAKALEWIPESETEENANGDHKKEIPRDMRVFLNEDEQGVTLYEALGNSYNVAYGQHVFDQEVLTEK
jgi:hypothetical protein